jgi:hypothetical protein
MSERKMPDWWKQDRNGVPVLNPKDVQAWLGTAWDVETVKAFMRHFAATEGLRQPIFVETDAP